MRKFFTRIDIQEILETNQLGAEVSYQEREDASSPDNYILYYRLSPNNSLYAEDTVHIKKALIQVTHYHKKKLDSIEDLIIENFGVEPISFDQKQLDTDFLATYFRFEILTKRRLVVSDIETREIRIDLKPQIKEILEETGKKCAEKIRANSPIGRSGEYSRGWTYEINDDLSVTVKNTGKHKTLGHLLEYGHLSKAKKRIPPQEHVRPAYNVCKIEYLEKLKKIEIK